MVNNDELFDIKMKEKFQKEVSEIPESINEEFENTLSIIKKKENVNMKRQSSRKKVAVAVASAICILTVTMQTTFAKNMVEKFIRSLSLNNITIFENKDYKWEDREMPEAAKGKVFDKDKNVIEKITLENRDQMYNADGEQVLGVEEDGTIITKEVQEENMRKNAKENPIDNIIVKDATKLNDYTCFDVKLPTHLPEGFKFDYAELFKEDGKIVKECISLYFKDNNSEKTIYMSQTYVCEEASSETSFNNIEKVKVNGADAIVGDEGITWEANGVNYLMYTEFGKAENIKIAESIKSSSAMLQY